MDDKLKLFLRAVRRAIAALILAVIACPPAAAAGRSVVDDLGFQVSIPEVVTRIVSLVPTNSEMVCLLDCSRLVGGTRYDRFPEALALRVRQRQIAIIGGGFDANLEKIVQLAPALIIANGPSQQKIALPLKRMGYPVLSLWPRDLAGLKKDFSLLGEILDRKGKARRILDQVEKGFLAIVNKAKGKPRKRVYLQMWSDPLITVGNTSFPQWLLEAAGGTNIFEDMPFDSGQVGLESIIRRDPEVLIFLTGQESFVQQLTKRAGWNAIRAVQRSHICFVDESDLNRRVQFLGGLARMHDCLFSAERVGQAISSESR